MSLDLSCICNHSNSCCFSFKGCHTFLQADCALAKIDINCHVQGDVVLECITLDDNLEHEEMMFRVMFNTAFIRSNVLMLNREEIDTLWNVKDRFPIEFRAEVSVCICLMNMF